MGAGFVQYFNSPLGRHGRERSAIASRESNVGVSAARDFGRGMTNVQNEFFKTVFSTLIARASLKQSISVRRILSLDQCTLGFEHVHKCLIARDRGLCHVRGSYLSKGRGAPIPHVYISSRAKSARKSSILGQCDNAIYRLCPALVHMRLFGAGYRPMVERLLQATST